MTKNRMLAKPMLMGSFNIAGPWQVMKGAKSAGSKVILRGVNDDIKNVFKLT
jgi:hypothetical protein